MVDYPLLWLAGSFIAILGLIFSQVPIGIAMAIVGVVGTGMIIGFGPALSLLAIEPANAINTADLATIPLFLLMGNFATAAGISADIFKAAQSYMGHWRGGMAMASITGCAGYGAICGSSSATAAAMGRIALPEMESRSYSSGLAAAVIATGGGLGILIPPSIIMVLYAVLTEQFVQEMFISAIGPGLLAILLYMLTIKIVVMRQPEAGPATYRAPWPERWRLTLKAWRAVITVLLVIVGIYTGVFTVLEAAAIGVAITGLFWLFSPARSFMQLREIFIDTAALTGMIIMMVIGAGTMGYLLTLTNAPQEIIDGVRTLGLPPFLVILLLLVMYVLLGMIFDSIAAMVLTLPFVFPLVTSLGYDPVWWGIINVMIIEIALITPPVGMNIFILRAVAPHVPIAEIFRYIFPFILANFAWLALMLAFPAIALWLPTTLK